MIAPAWLVRAALEGSREAGSPLGVGDPYLSWLYQPAVRTFRVRLYGDDLSFLQAGHPALFASDSSFTAFYPDYHKPSDTADKLDAAALERMGRGVLGVVHALERVPRGPAEEPHWFAAFGRVVGWPWLLGLGAASLLPGLWRGWRGRRARPRRCASRRRSWPASSLWRHPVPALWLLLVPHLLLPWRRSWWTVLLALAPALGLLAIGASAWWRGAVNGVWLAPWEIAVAALALALAFLGLGGGGGRKGGRPGARPESAAAVRQPPVAAAGGAPGRASRRILATTGACVAALPVPDARRRSTRGREPAEHVIDPGADPAGPLGEPKPQPAAEWQPAEARSSDPGRCGSRRAY